MKAIFYSPNGPEARRQEQGWVELQQGQLYFSSSTIEKLVTDRSLRDPRHPRRDIPPPSSNPEQFLRSLPHRFHGTYFWAEFDG